MNLYSTQASWSPQKIYLNLSGADRLHPDDGQDLDTLLRMADASMYHAKNCGRNTYRFFTDNANTAATAHMSKYDKSAQ